MASVDLPTIVASGLAGAATGALASWVAAPHVANRQERARRHSAIREALGELVGPVLTRVRQYQAHAYASMGREPDENNHHVDDILLCAQILTAAAKLTRIRNYLVVRRVRRLFGAETVELCGVHGQLATDPKAIMGILINRQYNASKHPDRFKQPDTGEYDKALRTPPESPEVEALIKALKALSESR